VGEFTQPDAGYRDAAFALRHEEDADPAVAAVYADIRRRLSFVPALFKALAVQPQALEEAWLQARALHSDARFAESIERIRRAAVGRGVGAVSDELRAAVVPFATELPGMLIVVSSLVLTLDGRLKRRPPTGAVPPAAAPPEPAVPELRGEHPLYERIRDVYGTMHVPTLYRSLASRGLLEEAWEVAHPLLTSDEGRVAVAALESGGEVEALGYPDAACFATASARPLLEQFRIALPRNLVVAVALSRADAR
jgi:hypothetical protein